MRNTDKNSNQLKFKRILQAAFNLFSEHGFENISMEQIAQNSNLTRRTIYSYFKNKEEIFLVLHIEGLKERISCLPQICNTDKSGLEILKEFGERYLAFYKNNPGYLEMQLYLEYKAYRIMDESSIEYQRFQNENDQLSESVLNLFKRGIADGSIRSDLNIDYYFDYYAVNLRSLASQVITGYKEENYYLNYLAEFMKMISSKQ